MPRFGHAGILTEAAGQGRGRAADGPEFAGQQVSPPAVHRRRLLVALLTAALFAPAAAALSVGDRVAWRDVVLLDGTTLPASRLVGRPVVVELWASWCPFCKNQNPRLEALWRDHGGRGLEFVTFSIDKDPAKARAYMAQHGYTFPAAMADAEVMRTFGARKGLPLLYVVGADGRVVQVEPSEMFDEDVHALARPRPPPTTPTHESTRVPESPRGGHRRRPADLRARRARPEGRGEALRRREAVRAGQLPALHRLPRAAPARPLPRAVGESRHRRRARASRRTSSAMRSSSTSASSRARPRRTRSPTSTSRRQPVPTARSAASRTWPRW